MQYFAKYLSHIVVNFLPKITHPFTNRKYNALNAKSQPITKPIFYSRRLFLSFPKFKPTDPPQCPH